MTLATLAMYCGGAFGSGVACGYVYKRIIRFYENIMS